MALSRPKRGFESRWGRHHGWQIHYSGQQSIKREHALEGVAAPSLILHRCESQRADEQRPKHGAVTYLTLEELKAAALHWKVDAKFD